MGLVEWLSGAVSFAFLDTAIGIVGAITVYVFVKLFQETRN